VAREEREGVGGQTSEREREREREREEKGAGSKNKMEKPRGKVQAGKRGGGWDSARRDGARVAEKLPDVLLTAMV